MVIPELLDRRTAGAMAGIIFTGCDCSGPPRGPGRGRPRGGKDARDRPARAARGRARVAGFPAPRAAARSSWAAAACARSTSTPTA